MNIVTSELEGTVYRRTPRNEPTLLIEVETDRVGTWSLCENAIEAPYHRGKKGTHKQRAVIYESEWATVQKMVRTDKHDVALANAIAMAPQTVPQGESVSLGEKRKRAEDAVLSAKPGPAQQRAESALADVEREIIVEANRLLCMTPDLRDGLPPLTSARIISKGAPPPTQSNLLMNQNGALAEAFTAAFRQLMAERDVSPKGKRGE